MEPEQFQLQPDPEHRAAHERSILFGYKAMDRLVGRTLELAGPDVTVVFCTGLSQQPCTTYDDRGGKTLFRPHDFTAFLNAVGIDRIRKVAPVMAQQFQIDLENEGAALDAEAKLKALALDGERVINAERKGQSLFAGCRIFHPVNAGAVVTTLGGERTIPFADLFYKIDMLKSGMHHPDGMLWIRTPERRHSVNPQKVPLVQVAPTLLRLLDLPCPASMTGGAIRARLRAESRLRRRIA